MRTYEEIDREEEAYVRAANVALAQMRDKGGRWWSYSVSHCTFELVVGEPFGEDNLVLSLAACEYISGPVDWPEQNIEVIWRCTGTGVDREWEFILQDEVVGFKARGGLFDWKKGFDLLDNPGLHTTLWYGGKSDKE